MKSTTIPTSQMDQFQKIKHLTSQTMPGSQTRNIGLQLLAGETITPLEALQRHGCFRLAHQIFMLREMGFQIETITIRDGKKRFAKYKLIENE